VVQEQRLSELLVEFAHTLATDYSTQGILDHLTTRILEVVPVTGAGVMLMGRDTDMHFASASDDVLLQIESLQIELGEGPCLEAYRTGQRVLVPDLNVDERFRRFSPRAVEKGLAAVFSFPMRADGGRIGAADLYLDEPGTLSEADATAGQILADVAAAYILNARGRDASQETERELRYRALHDPLTDLPNRTLLHDRITHAVDRSRRSHGVPAVLFIDLDRFKEVNDSLGHRAGDQLLVAVARRLHDTLRPGDTLARVGGDEFVVLCDELNDAGQAVTMAQRVTGELAKPFLIGGEEVAITASVGIAIARVGHETPDTLIQDADIAMYRAKQRGGGSHETIDETIRVQAAHRLRGEDALRRAVESGEMRLVYQPIFSVPDGGIRGVEALVRWEHPDRGLLAPGEFVPLAEETGLIVPIGLWVLNAACVALKRWGSKIPRPIIAVNVSAVQLTRSDFPAAVRSVLRQHDTDPAEICLEVTETVLMDDDGRVVRALEELKEIGVTLAIDDFGTGYCSLTYLRRFPVDQVKIDRSFVEGLGSDSQDTAIVSAVTNLAHDLGLTVVAEGVETEQQLRMVGEIGCDLVQGYHLSFPLEAAGIDALMASMPGEG